MSHKALNQIIDTFYSIGLFLLGHLTVRPLRKVKQSDMRFSQNRLFCCLTILYQLLHTHLIGLQSFIDHFGCLRQLNSQLVACDRLRRYYDGLVLRGGPILHAIRLVVIAHPGAKVDNQADVLIEGKFAPEFVHVKFLGSVAYN